MKKSSSIFRIVSLFILSVSVILSSCSKDKDITPPGASFAGQYKVVDDTDSYTLKVENKGGNNFDIHEFGGFLNVPIKAVADGSTLKIPAQTFNGPNGNKIIVKGTGALSTKNSKDDTIIFQYSVSGVVNYDGDFTGTRK